MTRHGLDASALRDLTYLLAEPPRQVRGGAVFVRQDVLSTLGRLVSADWVAFSDTAPLRHFTWAESDSITPDEPDAVWDGEGDRDNPFWDLYWDSQCSYPDRTGDMSITVLSDFMSIRELRRTPMHAFHAECSFDREMMLPLPGLAGHSRRIRFIRISGREFDDTDRAVATIVRPHLLGYLHHLDLASRGVAPLTTRQRQLMSLVAEGFSNTQIARTLGITPDTVRTHLQQIYARLNVSSRGEAVAVVSTPGTVASLGTKSGPTSDKESKHAAPV